jgi:hypothetical protein
LVFEATEGSAMTNIFSQVSYQIFLDCVLIFFMLASAFSFIVGLGLVMRSPRMLRFFEFMNRGFSVRRLDKILFMPHFVEPVLLKHSSALGIVIIVGAAASVLMLWNVDADVFQPVFLGYFVKEEAEILAGYTKSFLLVGNVICIAVGLLALFFPHLLSRIETYTDKWYTLRKQTRPLSQMHLEVDKWVMAHPTVSGLTLSTLSLILCFTMYARF